MHTGVSLDTKCRRWVRILIPPGNCDAKYKKQKRQSKREARNTSIRQGGEQQQGWQSNAYKTTKQRSKIKKENKPDSFLLDFLSFGLKHCIHLRECLYLYLFTSNWFPSSAVSRFSISSPRGVFASCWAFPSCGGEPWRLVSKLTNGLNQLLTTFGHTRFKDYQVDGLRPIRDFTTTEFQLVTKEVTYV